MATPVGNSVPLLTSVNNNNGTLTEEFISGLVQGSSWTFGTDPRVITYSFDLNFDGATQAWTSDWTNAVANAFAAWQAVANIQFVQAGTPNAQTQNLSTADIAIALAPGEGEGVIAGLGIFPDPALADALLSEAGYSRNSGEFPVPRPEGDITFDNLSSAFSSLQPGTQGFYVLLHEIGHALGLKHTNDDGGNGKPAFSALGLGSYETTDYTIMGGAVPTAGLPYTPMLADILAIQNIYGANMSFHTGNDNYAFVSTLVQTIWDAGGVDTLDASIATGNMMIDLRPGSNTKPINGGGGQVAIAFGVTIENAIGAYGDDTIIGNDASNTLSGGYGNDSLIGGAGDDTLYGVFGNDILDGGSGNDTLNGGTNWDNGGSDFDTLMGGAGDDTLHGWFGNDMLDGGSGNDTLDGGAGLDAAGYAGIHSQYLLAGNPSGGASIDGPEGTDSLASIETLQFVDGSRYYDPYSHVAQVYRLYEATLNRAGDVLGVNYHTGLLDAGWTLSQDASFFVTSPEFQGNYGSLTNTQFVELVYQNVLHRAADGPGLAYWTGLMSSGWTKGDVVVSFSESAENVGNHAAQINAGIWDINEMAASVARLYWGTLDRAPDAGGLIYWAGLIQGGYPIQSTAANFVGSPEFQGNYGSLNNTQFVNQLYLNVLDRPADSGGLAYWTGLLTGGATRGDVTLGFTESTEFQVNMLGQIEGGITTLDGNYVT